MSSTAHDGPKYEAASRRGYLGSGDQRSRQRSGLRQPGDSRLMPPSTLMPLAGAMTGLPDDPERLKAWYATISAGSPGTGSACRLTPAGLNPGSRRCRVVATTARGWSASTTTKLVPSTKGGLASGRRNSISSFTATYRWSLRMPRSIMDPSSPPEIACSPRSARRAHPPN